MRVKQHARVLVIQIGGLGDLVLASETIARLKQARPGWHISLMCRAEVAPVVDLYPVRPDEVVELAFNPYGWDAPSEELYAALEPVLPILQSLDPDLLIAASLQPTWFSWFAIAATQARAAVCCTRSAEPVSFLDLVLRRFGLSRRPVRRIEPEPDTHERSRYGLILKNLHVRPKAGFPWALHHHLEREASLRLTDLGLQERRYFVCFPTGSENTKIKRWPEDRFVEVLTDITGELELPVLLIGETADEPQLSRIAGALASHGGEARNLLWTSAGYSASRRLGVNGVRIPWKRHRSYAPCLCVRGTRGRYLRRRVLAELCPMGKRFNRPSSPAPMLRVQVGLCFRAWHLRRID